MELLDEDATTSCHPNSNIIHVSKVNKIQELQWTISKEIGNQFYATRWKEYRAFGNNTDYESECRDKYPI